MTRAYGVDWVPSLLLVSLVFFVLLFFFVLPLADISLILFAFGFFFLLVPMLPVFVPVELKSFRNRRK